MHNMRKLLIALILILGCYIMACGQTVVDPATFPLETSPNNSNWEFYSRKTGQNRRATLDAIRLAMLPLVRQPNTVGYTPAPVNNPNDRGSFVRTSTGGVFYIDGLGNAMRLNPTLNEVLIFADNDEDARDKCVPLEGRYKLSVTNTLGGSPGDVRVRIFGGVNPTGCISQ